LKQLFQLLSEKIEINQSTMNSSLTLFFVLGSILVSTQARPRPEPGLLGSYPPEKTGCFIAGWKKFFILLGNDHEVEFHEIKIQLFHEMEFVQ
jgi:hypothetical protein